MAQRSLYSVIALLLLGALVSCVHMAVEEGVQARLIVTLFYCTAAMWSTGFNVGHPVVWLLPFLYLYNYGYIVLGQLGYVTVDNPDGILWIGWLAIWAFSVASLVVVRTHAYDHGNLSGLSRLGKSTVTKTVYHVVLVASVMYVIWFYVSGVGTKAEWSRSGMLDLQFVFGVLLLMYCIRLIVTVLVDDVKPWGMIGVMAVLSLLILVVVGERDVFLRVAVITGFVLYQKYRPSLALVALASAAVISLIPIMGRLKNLAVKDAGDIDLQRTEIWVIDLLRGEFASAGRNIDVLLSAQSSWKYFYGETYIWDIGRALIPAPLYNIRNAGAWYMQTFHSGAIARGQGYGFTLAGEGYLNFGYLGVIAVYLLLAVCVSHLYNRARLNGVAMVVYLFMAPIIVYSTRGDLSVILSPLLKQVFVPLTIVWATSLLLRRRREWALT